MKTTTRLLLSALAGAALCTGAQIIHTNEMGRVQAIKLASRLKVGMETDAMIRFLETNGLPAGFTVGGIGYGTRVYVLSDGCSLCLDTASTPGVWTNNVVRSACIQSNGVKIESITLRTRP
jgi:hypothetical protein